MAIRGLAWPSSEGDTGLKVVFDSVLTSCLVVREILNVEFFPLEGLRIPVEDRVSVGIEYAPTVAEMRLLWPTWWESVVKDVTWQSQVTHNSMKDSSFQLFNNLTSEVNVAKFVAAEKRKFTRMRYPLGRVNRAYMFAVEIFAHVVPSESDALIPLHKNSVLVPSSLIRNPEDFTDQVSAYIDGELT